MGLGAIYTKYKDSAEDLEIDVLFTKDVDSDNFVSKIKLSKYANNIYSIKRADFGKNIKRINKLKKNFLGKFLYEKVYRPRIHKIIKSKIPNFCYDEVFFSHELPFSIITFLKDISEKTNFVIYGDGSGLLMGKDTKLINPYKKPTKNPFIQEIRPNEIVALAPIIEDDSFDAENIPVMGTEPKVLSDLIENDIQVQEKVNDYTDSILEKYPDNKNIILLLTNALDDKRFNMNEEDQVNIYFDMIDKYCPENSVVILKLHPTSKVDIAKILKEKCKKNCIFEVFPNELKEYPIEIYSKLIKKSSLVITFISSSRVSLSLMYNVDTSDAFDVIQNYSLKHRVNPVLNVLQKNLELYPNWDKKNVLYQCDIVPQLEEFYEKYGGVNTYQKK